MQGEARFAKKANIGTTSTASVHTRMQCDGALEGILVAKEFGHAVPCHIFCHGLPSICSMRFGVLLDENTHVKVCVRQRCEVQSRMS